MPFFHIIREVEEKVSRVSFRGEAEGKLPLLYAQLPPEILNINQQNNHL